MGRRTSWIATGILAMGLAAPACTSIEGDPGLDEIAIQPNPPSGDIVVRWNNIAQSTLLPMDPASSARAFAMVHVAMHDAIEAQAGRFETYLLTIEDENADPVVAAAQAAHDVLVGLRPDKQSSLDAELAKDLAKAQNNNKRSRGVALGKAAAQLILADRTNDGTQLQVPYTPGSGPGKYQYTPPFNFVVLTQWPQVKPFVLASGSQFRPGPPPALDSQEWADDYNEVQLVGSATSTVRTADQSEMAVFWTDNSVASVSRQAIAATNGRRSNLYDTARGFALAMMAMTDGAIVVLDAKYEYDFWRPITAIRAGDTDGRADTVADPAWNQYIVAPPFPEYTSGHACTGIAAAMAMTEVWGDDFSYSLTSAANNATRHYDNFEDAGIEGGESRILGGIHYRTSVELGWEEGYAVGAYLIANSLQPVTY